jgi:predicted PurR-regulated permease PerM
LLFLAAFVLLGWLGVPSLLHQIAQVGSNLEASIADLVAQFVGKDTINLFGTQTNAQSIAQNIVTFLGAFLSTHALGIVEYTFTGMFGIILSWVLLGYMLFGGGEHAESLFWLLPPSRRDVARRVWIRLSPVLRRYFLGVLLVVIYASAAAYVGLGLILHIHDALFLAILTGLLEVIPVVGPVASGTIAGLVAMGQAQSSWNIIEYIIYAVALRVSIDEFFAPIVLGKAAYLPPVLVIFCFLAGGMLFGIVGVIMAVPVALAVKALLGEVYHEEGLRQQA